MFAVKAKIYGVDYSQSSSIAFDEWNIYLLISAKKLLISQFFISHHTVVWFGPKAYLITESDQAARAVHSCNSWFV